MKKGLTELVCILDRSGSMGGLVDETIVKFNQFIKEQKEVPGEATVTVVLFDDQYEILHKGIKLADLPKLTGEVYFARGWTAFQDAMGKTINEVGARIDGLPEEEKPEKVIFMVITDGLENRSQEFQGPAGKETIKKMVEHQTEKYGWGFLFLGANMDAVQVGAGFGFAGNMSANYANTGKGLSSAYSASGDRVRVMRCSASPKDYKALHNLDDDTEK